MAVATQSSTCWGNPASNAINGDHGDISHTCENSDSPAWWMVDLGDDNTPIGEGMFSFSYIASLLVLESHSVMISFVCLTYFCLLYFSGHC